ncbi:MAG: PilZ domain-containing protein [Deltaproteobacteria bacterium]|nr:PilZ domain-containing protein [Deltaproteobacteria bacterium]MBW1951673.1 PilZ domain-containing protein [Deltaproteobacteria bacterium]MBW1985772.1 PilZ domain-containing protein [Deltaproteobacteria bacterium]MBW2134687.1 PilZ domain-containing protein [Deltaproteobacteria bacterium]
MTSWFEKRRHQRLNVALPMVYKIINRGRKNYKEYKAVTKNISMGGIYFVCLVYQDLNINQILNITIELPRQAFNLPGTTILKTRGQVLRIEEMPQRPYVFGVALKFLDTLQFAEA